MPNEVLPEDELSMLKKKKYCCWLMQKNYNDYQKLD